MHNNIFTVRHTETRPNAFEHERTVSLCLQFWRLAPWWP